MDPRPSLRRQFAASLRMLEDCLKRCTDEQWTAGEHPRATWRIAYHALYYLHLYFFPSLAKFEPWPKNIEHARQLWLNAETGEPPEVHPYSREDLIEYTHYVEARYAGWIDALDLDAQTCGFPWYSMPKLDLMFLSLRHFSLHVGQVQERLIQAGEDPTWIGEGTTG
jgi:hypothetical protein